MSVIVGVARLTPINVQALLNAPKHVHEIQIVKQNVALLDFVHLGIVEESFNLTIVSQTQSVLAKTVLWAISPIQSTFQSLMSQEK